MERQWRIRWLWCWVTAASVSRVAYIVNKCDEVVVAAVALEAPPDMATRCPLDELHCGQHAELLTGFNLCHGFPPLFRVTSGWHRCTGPVGHYVHGHPARDVFPDAGTAEVVRLDSVPVARVREGGSPAGALWPKGKPIPALAGDRVPGAGTSFLARMDSRTMARAGNCVGGGHNEVGPFGHSIIGPPPRCGSLRSDRVGGGHVTISPFGHKNCGPPPCAPKVAQ